jgi:hypothetical protein
LRSGLRRSVPHGLSVEMPRARRDERDPGAESGRRRIWGLIEAEALDQRVALLIEDKITASASARQAERYSRHKQRLLDQGTQLVFCILVAPAAYRGERLLYDASVDFETVSELLRSSDAARLAYRRGIIQRALTKSASTGVKIPDHRLRELKEAYLLFAQHQCAIEGLPLTFPPLRSSYYDGDSWVAKVRHPSLPSHIWLRHRLWTSVRSACGQVDLIASPVGNAERRWILERAPEEAIRSDFSKGKGVQLSLVVREMRQDGGFNPTIGSEAISAMRTLVHWYEGQRDKDAIPPDLQPPP